MAGVDFHTHLAPPLGDRIGPEALYRPDLLVTWLDEQGLDQAVVSVPPPFFRPSRAEAVNDGLLEAVAPHLDRLRPLAYLPAEHPETACAEARARQGQPWAGAVLAAGPVDLADPGLDPLWRLLHESAAFVFLHPAASPDPRLDAFYLHNLLGNPVETAIAAAQLVFGDVLGRYPWIRFCLAHAGGCVPTLAGRWQRGYETGRPGIRPLTEPPRQAVPRFWADCLAHDPAVLRLAVETFGADQIVLGSDWPFPMGHPAPAALLDGLPEPVARRIAVENAERVLAVQPGEPR